MIWVQIVLAVIGLLLKVPQIQEWLERIFGSLKQAGPVRAGREGKHVLAVLQDKLKQVETGQLSVTCPVEKLAHDLEQKYGP
jgi:hypothetical protein